MFLSTIVFLLACFLGLPPLSYASESSLTVAPSIIEQVVTLGGIATGSATLINNTNFPLPIKAQAGAFITNYHLTTTQASTFDASSWFTLSPADFL